MKGENSLKVDTYAFGILCWMVFSDSALPPNNFVLEINKFVLNGLKPTSPLELPIKTQESNTSLSKV